MFSSSHIHCDRAGSVLTSVGLFPGKLGVCSAEGNNLTVHIIFTKAHLNAPKDLTEELGRTWTQAREVQFSEFSESLLDAGSPQQLWGLS